ncbi:MULTISPECIES: hypothetical protein [unclassified Mesorhizobium]|uniref:hypothetical protein n=1 Tax=unclassified Mesorhizobium TaxID=325217 RepID=UPI000FD24772|nr:MULTISPECIES: hypothetical protein [unclassified Mesorhizobium]RUU86597.1 hypothetical protein EOB59_28450 [Mesorhizobium sp. M7A.F.Ca.MR.176.00.0.0]RWO87786.1 MAG: hypothetical protein EOQ96_09545 [Mesorhizobium sp.]RWP11992.1 MAG: hypothetical protein EOQ97_08045 [Mesorhizobium sp.]RWQ20290.1 MAG: hypothetical protein EOR93_14600 [Mesorhizobium sp.]TIU38886.1 MAG: hypothetical protein E5W26_16070 [Mesorhizobium sp.]
MPETEREYTERILRDMIAEANAAEQAEADEARTAKAQAARAIAAKAEAVLARAVKPILPRAGKADHDLARPVEPALPRAPQAVAAEMTQASRDSLIDGLFPRTEWPQPPKAPFPRLKKTSDRRSDFVIAALGITLGLICALFPWYIFFNQDQFGVQAMKFGGTGSNSGRAGGGVVAQRSAPLTAKDIPAANLDLLATGTVRDDANPAAAPDEQPFPADAAKFRMVHVANGRAMIQDDAGLWIVQRGSILPDSSQVSSIEQRNGKWVMVTSADRVIELSR